MEFFGAEKLPYMTYLAWVRDESIRGEATSPADCVHNTTIQCRVSAPTERRAWATRRDAKTRGSRYSQSATMGRELSAVDRGKVIIILLYWSTLLLTAFLSLDHCIMNNLSNCSNCLPFCGWTHFYRFTD